MVEEARLILPVGNVGTGPALEIEADVFFLDVNGKPSVGCQPFTVRRGVATALGAGAAVALQSQFRGLAEPMFPFRVTLTYRDAFSGRYDVSGVYFPEEQVYRDLSFRPPEGLTVL
jgi:hypothetical protein